MEKMKIRSFLNELTVNDVIMICNYRDVFSYDYFVENGVIYMESEVVNDAYI